jgi:chorismate lyase/3-hydroxybenzoate synthase
MDAPCPKRISTRLIFDALSSTDGSPESALDAQCVLRIYLRDPADYQVVADKLRSRLSPNADQLAFLHGEICRRELVLEIDGVRVQ